uniref:Uncharacterized protein n=1 Tax=Ditylenchus dipsaci TaxID=166011 RepID=A0A915ED38_9BILA
MLGCNGRTCPGTLGAISDLLPVKQNNSEIQPMIVPLPVSQLVIGASEHQLSDEEEEDYEEEQEQEVDTPLTLLNPRKNNLINNNNSRLSDEEPLKQPLFSGLQIDSPC